MRAAVTAIFVVTMGLVACGDEGATDPTQTSTCLPGDIDCNTDPSTGKADAWNYANDPARLSQMLNYRLAELPLQGSLDTPVWADRYPNAVGKAPIAWSDTYWPSAQGSTNKRWQGGAIKSPLEKYDAAFNEVEGCPTQPSRLCGDTAKAEWDAYFACAGPAARWQIESFQSVYEQVDGVDNDNDGKIDECDSSDDEGAQGWWGLCHAWTVAALLEPEPQKAVTYNGVTFEVADIKALIVTVYDRNEAMMLGGRCNAKTFDPDNTTDANDKCFDSNPGALHVVITNFIGINDSALAMDKTATYEVWNQPITGYDITKQDKVEPSVANACVGATGDEWTYNDEAEELYEVTMVVEYLVEGSASTQPLGMTSYTSYDSYHYIIEVNADGKVVGGRYCSDSEGSHPDFLWAPIRVATSSWGRNPHVALDKMRTLLNLAFADDAVVDPGTETKDYDNTTATDVPDNDIAGAEVDIDVADSFTFAHVAVTYDIEHTWIGDLKVELLKDGGSVAVLHDETGGSQQNLTATTTLTAAALGVSEGAGTWTLRVVDSADRDTGTVKSFKLSFSL